MDSETTVLDILFPRVRAEILRSLFGGLKDRRYVRELARETGLALCTVQDELRKLGGVELVISYSNGYHRFYAPNASHPLFKELQRIVELSKRLPRTKRSALFRRQSRNSARKRRRHPRPSYRIRPASKELSWNIFSNRRRKT